MVFLGLKYCQGTWGKVPAINSLMRISGTKFGKVSRGGGFAVDAVVKTALCREMAQSAT